MRKEKKNNQQVVRATRASVGLFGFVIRRKGVQSEVGGRR